MKRPSTFVLLVTLCFALAPTASAQTELTINGGFETGDFTGWNVIPSAAGNTTIQTPGFASTFAGCIDNMVVASASLIKNENIGVGMVMPGQTITISLDARGATAVGGVVFAEFFSELAGGGVSQSEILGGAPLALDPDPNIWTNFTFTTTAGADVSGGVTLQLAAITGAAPGSASMVCFDNASVTIVVPVATYPGSGEDLVLTSAVGAGGPSAADVKTAAPGDTLLFNVASPGGTYDTIPYFLIGQLFTTGSPSSSVPGFPELHLDPNAPLFLLVNGNLVTPLGFTHPILPGTGSTTGYTTPPGLAGLSLLTQSIVSDTLTPANNGFFAITDGHEIQF